MNPDCSVAPFISVDMANNNICKVLLDAARKTIPLNKSHRFKSFCNETLADLKNARETARLKAQKSALKEDISSWSELAKGVKSEVNIFKRVTFENFIRTNDFKIEGRKRYGFLANLTNKRNIPKEQPLFKNNKQFADDRDIAEAFVDFIHDSKLKLGK